jgi:hypothetical protein
MAPRSAPAFVDQISGEQIHADPPRLVYGRSMKLDHELLWVTSIDWVSRYSKLIGKVFGGLRRVFPGTEGDLRSLALQVAYETMHDCLHSGNVDVFPAQFCGRLRNELIGLCAGPPIDRSINPEDIADHNAVPGSPGTPWGHYRHPSVLAKGLPHMTRRQQKAWRQYLSGRNLIDSGIVSREDRGIAILNNGIARVQRRCGGVL